MRVRHGIWVYDAIQYQSSDYCNCQEIDDFIGLDYSSDWDCDEELGTSYSIETTWGVQRLMPGDWVVGRVGDASLFWKIKKEIFQNVFTPEPKVGAAVISHPRLGELYRAEFYESIETTEVVLHDSVNDVQLDINTFDHEMR